MFQYVPTDEDVVWAKTMVRVIRDGGILAYPDAAIAYRVNHNNRTLSLQCPDRLISEMAIETHMRTIAVFRLIGYRVIVQDDISTAAIAWEIHMADCKQCCTKGHEMCSIGAALMGDFYLAVITAAQRGG